MKIIMGILCMLLFAALLQDPAAGRAHFVNDLTLEVVDASHAGEVTVLVKNDSSNPIRIWKESNSWGAARWRILLIRNGQLQTFFQNPDQDFTVNWPTFDKIAAKTSVNKKLLLNNGGWRGVEDQKIAIVPGDLVIVIYDVPFTQESLKLGVWYGVTSASTIIR